MHSWLPAIICCTVACGQARRRPELPAPVYENPSPLAWDAGTPQPESIDELLDAAQLPEPQLPQSPEGGAGGQPAHHEGGAPGSSTSVPQSNPERGGAGSQAAE
jgi:hypothetical protein